MMTKTAQLGMAACAALGLIVGASCSDGLEAVAADAADGVAGVVNAVDVGFSDSVAQLSATNVQAAIEALDGRLDAVEATGTTVVSRVSALEAQSGATPKAVQDALDALTADGQARGSSITSLEGRVTALEGAGVQAALATLNDALAAQQAKIEALEAKVAAIGHCPEGFWEVGDSCVEKSARDPSAWGVAASICEGDDLRMCTYEEHRQACNFGLVTKDAPEWTANWIGLGEVVTVAMSNAACGSGFASTPITAPAMPFRCCRTRH